MISELLKKDISPEIFSEKIVKNPSLINQYLEGLLSKNETYRYNCFKVLNALSEKRPEILYNHWDFFIDHLRSENNYHKMSAISIIGNLTSVDKEKRFEKIFNEFYNNLKSKKTIVPIYTIKSSGKIVNFKPHLEKKITDLLLNIENIHHGNQIELVKSAVIDSFSEFYDKSEKKEKIIIFIKKQLKSDSPKTKKAAKDFINKWGRD